MSESQSRYGIISALTSQRLQIMSAKADLKEEAQKKDQTVLDLRSDLANWKKDVLEDNKRTERTMDLEIQKAINIAKYSQQKLRDKEKVYDEKIRAIDEALKRIEDISKTAPNP